jgi:hypothetical protein
MTHAGKWSGAINMVTEGQKSMSRRVKIIWLGILGILLMTATIISQVGGNLAAELVREPLERAFGEY